MLPDQLPEGFEWNEDGTGLYLIDDDGHTWASVPDVSDEPYHLLAPLPEPGPSPDEPGADQLAS